ncbi:hypothetical protein [Phaeobacter italicus]|uniref:hypothetical protein n=1 Tax=Phaeobacter italicus TaxID=481446 RepID=UPI001CD4964C|nr:hypothetical protein [Phaeobacter italicus]MCA0856124.1 hypothetical protein [Phaeobacter italicus]
MTDTSKEAVLKEATEACRDMARWIANSRIKAVRPLWESHMQKAQRAINMINAENEALRKAVDSYSYIGRDGKMVLAKDLEDERDALRAQLQAARECLQATVRKANGDVEPVPAFYHPQVNDTSALKSTSAEGENDG